MGLDLDSRSKNTAAGQSDVVNPGFLSSIKTLLVPRRTLLAKLGAPQNMGLLLNLIKSGRMLSYAP